MFIVFFILYFRLPFSLQCQSHAILIFTFAQSTIIGVNPPFVSEHNQTYVHRNVIVVISSLNVLLKMEYHDLSE